MQDVITYMTENFGYIMTKTFQHTYLFLTSWVLAIIVGMAIGIFVSRPGRQKVGKVVLSITSITQSVPSIAVIALVFVFMGIGAAPSIFALFLYSLVPIVFNTASGLLSVDKKMIEAAKGMGMTKNKVLWSIEIPNSISTIFSGLRNSAIINIGTTTIASAVGAGGLGEIIFIGLSYFDYAMIISGAIPVSLMAIFTDVILAFIEKNLTSKGLRLIN